MVRIGGSEEQEKQLQTSSQQIFKTDNSDSSDKFFKNSHSTTKRQTNNDLLSKIKNPSFQESKYSLKITEEETNIHNIIERAKEPLKRPNETPIVIIEKGPHNGKLEQFPQRANGTYRTIETLSNGETYECTYSQYGTILNEIKRDKHNIQITTFSKESTDKVNIKIQNKDLVFDKIQTGNFLYQSPPTLQEITKQELDGFLIK